MATSMKSASPDLIPRRLRPFNMAYYIALGENEDGELEYTRVLVRRVRVEKRRGNARGLDGHDAADQNVITIEFRDCNIAALNLPTYDKDFLLIYGDGQTPPDENLTPETAKIAGLMPWSPNQITPKFNVAGQLVQMEILAN